MTRNETLLKLLENLHTRPLCRGAYFLINDQGVEETCIIGSLFTREELKDLVDSNINCGSVNTAFQKLNIDPMERFGFGVDDWTLQEIQNLFDGHDHEYVDAHIRLRLLPEAEVEK